ncbi:MAG: ABC transporter substrate-binding protein [Bryobacteraceae bacterium]|nr:ABC transporter substrate-binding protein [Bryobacteraceae bacterium]
MRTAFLAAALILASCSRTQSAKPLTVAVNAGVEGSALKAAAKAWGEQNRFPIEVVELPYANLFEKEMMDLAGGGGAYDVLMIDDPWFPRLSEGGRLTPLPRPPDADFAAPALDVCRVPYRTGNFQALPYVGNSQLFFYRKDLFDKYGLGAPGTWRQVLEAARRIGAAEKMFGYVMRAAPGNAVVADFMPLLWAFGGDIFDAQGAVIVDRPEAVEALQFMVELGKVSPPGYTGFNADEVAAHLLQSTAVMSINWPAWISAMDNPAKSKVVGKVEFARMPSAKAAGVGELGAWLLAIPAASPNKDRALEFIYWATSPEQMTLAARAGNPPTRRGVFQNPELVKQFRAFPAQLASLESARPRPRTPQWNEIENAFGIALSKANTGSLSPRDALSAAARDIRAIVERGR